MGGWLRSRWCGAMALVWLALSWDECREGLQRGPHDGMNPSDPDAVNAWAGAHSDRLAGHAQNDDGFDGHKVRLRTRREMAAFSMDGLSAAAECELPN